MGNSLPAKFYNTILVATLTLTVFAPFTLAQNADNVIRIGYQKYGTLVLLKARGSLEKRLAPLQVQWEKLLLSQQRGQVRLKQAMPQRPDQSIASSRR